MYFFFKTEATSLTTKWSYIKLIDIISSIIFIFMVREKTLLLDYKTEYVTQLYVIIKHG